MPPRRSHREASRGPHRSARGLGGPMRALILSALLGATVAAADEIKYLSADDATGGSVAVIVRDIPLVNTAQFTDPAAGGTKRTAAEQADGALRVVLAAVKAGGGDPDRVVRLNVGVATAEAVDPVREAIAKRFPAVRRPAITLVVGKLPAQDAVVAMDAVAPVAAKVDRVERIGGVKGLSPVGGSAAAVLPAGRRVYVSGQAEK